MSNILTRPYKRPEKDLRRSLTKKFKSFGMFVKNIESGDTDPGIPDMYVDHLGGHFWAELKTVPEPKRAGTLIRPAWQDDQIPWAEEYKKHRKKSGKWFLIIQVGTEIFYSSVPRKVYKRSELKPFADLLRAVSR